MVALASVLSKSFRLLHWLVALGVVLYAVNDAYRIRLFAIETYGPVIHEFDPWFNYRATEFLAYRGWHAFFTWFDHMAWHPLGRPIATTIYPGMQIVSVAIWKSLALARAWGLEVSEWSLNDVCCYVPAWLGSVATFFTALMAHEGAYKTSGGSPSAAACTAAIMAIIPAHAQRSVGGGYDNESVAMSAMVGTFYLWNRSLRSETSWPVGILAGLAYMCMASTWGGYVFVINVIGLHAAAVLLLGYDTERLYRAYSCFFFVGTLGAMRVPVVGWTPLRSLEQIGPLALFIALQALRLYQAVRKRGRSEQAADTNQDATTVQAFLREHVLSLSVTGAVGVALIAIAASSESFAPLSGRVRVIFGSIITRTGNPLVDSVTEHRASSTSAYWTYLDKAGYVALAGPAILLLQGQWPSESALFLLVLGVTTQFFSLKMARLMLLMGPSVSALAGVALGFVVDFGLRPLWRSFEGPSKRESGCRPLEMYNSPPVRLLRVALAAAFLHAAVPYWQDFYGACVNTVRWTLSHPQIMSKRGNGEINDELREAYWWLRDNTPAESRVLSWWDYGYQIAGIANRTTLADGNTWNQEHIGLVGVVLSSPLHESHAIARHLADYILVWKEDVGKSSHFGKIGSSAFPGHCEEPSCNQYGIYKGGQPTKMMRESLVWHLNREAQDGELARYFQVVHQSRFGKVRIAKVLNVCEQSKSWNADPNNRLCDAPGSWYCPGQYPPLLRQLLAWDPIPESNSEAMTYQRAYRGRVAEQLAAAPGPHEEGIPPGTYVDSCQGCRLEDSGKLLHCARCLSPGHASSVSRLSLEGCPPPGEVDNIHGDLDCKPRPNEADLPAGGYLGSCLGCKIEADGKSVVCSHCSTSDGHRRESSYSLDRCPAPHTLDNNDGVLVCNGIPNADNIPPGGYRDSCHGCALSADGRFLKCTHCLAADKRQLESVVDVTGCPMPPAKIDNQNGKLACTGIPNARNIPPGGYRNSCNGCRIDNGWLRCMHCRAADGSQAYAHAELAKCPPPGVFDNMNGRLVCSSR
eukprot:TRINITY_DN25620_c0_g1_i1.p1 TRINITY_DN25620_c0_g1~~TRINITY_DN25620_c0_g1_i1.p1  ORF type:complete len:1033 (+),score=90.75 TRINITY_DN25620_c0_g1_i1:64-3162(+)